MNIASKLASCNLKYSREIKKAGLRKRSECLVQSELAQFKCQVIVITSSSIPL